jgi:hypothetical protein
MSLEQIPWRETALRAMPEYAEQIRGAETPYMLWMEIFPLFEAAYNEPRDISLIERIYKYAAWCETQLGGETAADDLATCIHVCFYEHIPQCEAARDDIPNWFTQEEFTAMRGTFSYTFTDEEYSKIEKGFDGRSFRPSPLECMV